MNPPLVPDTLLALGRLAPEERSRSLVLDRYAHPGWKEGPRRQHFDQVIRGARSPERIESYAKFAHTLAGRGGIVLYGRLESRLMVNMAGGVMENAGLCLDRYGIPYIPASAIKGCARRLALQGLRDWCHGEDPRESEVYGASFARFDSVEDLLLAICEVFGWVSQDWSAKRKDGHCVSDLSWACEEKRDVIWKKVAESIGSKLSVKIRKPEKPWEDLPDFGGCVAFLPAYPNRDPGLELDVVTPHHAEYYRSSDPNAIARDTEDPVPVLFPVVRPQQDSDFFLFPLTPIRDASGSIEAAAAWLASGLEVFGLGAKTNAGYGWFNASSEFQQAIRERLERIEDEEVRKAEQKLKDKEAAEKLRAKKERDADLDKMPPEDRADLEIKQLSDDQFHAKVRAFCKNRGAPSDVEKRAIVRALRGNRLAYWQDFKSKATKGQLATVADAIRTLSKEMELGKMP